MRPSEISLLQPINPFSQRYRQRFEGVLESGDSSSRAHISGVVVVFASSSGASSVTNHDAAVTPDHFRRHFHLGAGVNLLHAGIFHDLADILGGDAAAGDDAEIAPIFNNAGDFPQTVASFVSGFRLAGSENAGKSRGANFANRAGPV